jgi:hypothetical protein
VFGDGKMDHSFERFPRIALMVVLAIGVGAAWRAQADAPPDRYMINSSQGFVTDLRTGLIWQQPLSPQQYTWDAASSYCRSLSLGGMAGFRIPSLKELMTLVDPTRVRPAIDPKAFATTPLEWFWTASTRSPLGTAAVSFETGGTGYFAGSNRLRVRCVR